MGQRCHHGERAFERHLRERKVPFVSINEARKSLAACGCDDGSTLKSFDYVVYGRRRNLLVEIKCRHLSPGAGRSRMPCWVTRDDLASLTAWEGLFGPAFEAHLVFLYWCDPPQATGPLSEECFKFEGRWYAIRAVPVREYAAHVRVRSPRWGTVHLPAAAFDRLSGPLLGVEAGVEAAVGTAISPWNRGALAANRTGPALPGPAESIACLA